MADLVRSPLMIKVSFLEPDSEYVGQLGETGRARYQIEIETEDTAAVRRRIRRAVRRQIEDEVEWLGGLVSVVDEYDKDGA